MTASEIDRLHQKARECRAAAEQLSSPGARQEMLRIAESYERQAKSLEGD